MLVRVSSLGGCSIAKEREADPGNLWPHRRKEEARAGSGPPALVSQLRQQNGPRALGAAYWNHGCETHRLLPVWREIPRQARAGRHAAVSVWLRL